MTQEDTFSPETSGQYKFVFNYKVHGVNTYVGMSNIMGEMGMSDIDAEVNLKCTVGRNAKKKQILKITEEDWQSPDWSQKMNLDESGSLTLYKHLESGQTYDFKAKFSAKFSASRIAAGGSIDMKTGGFVKLDSVVVKRVN